MDARDASASKNEVTVTTVKRVTDEILRGDVEGIRKIFEDVLKNGNHIGRRTARRLASMAKAFENGETVFADKRKNNENGVVLNQEEGEEEGGVEETKVLDEAS